ncbi:MAG: hypothetical protein D6674_00065 [Acidobacteria bacterium]|jgi:hypothetical protein|nr:MAG: hypothetical protein D6674_00065 [Acidobacteriota bacterium]
MERTLRAFYEIALAHTDLRWAKSRDDLISKTIKVLRVFKEGKGLEEVEASRELSSEIETQLNGLLRFVRENSQEVDKLIDLLSMFVKSPAPCKIKLISFVEVLLEDR